MTIQELLNCSADKLEAMSDEQLEEWFKPMFPVTRPDPNRKSASAQGKKKHDPKLDEAVMLAKQFGIDLSGIMKGF